MPEPSTRSATAPAARPLSRHVSSPTATGTLQPTIKQYYFGFNYLRAFLALAVIAWHVNLFGTSHFFRIRYFPQFPITLPVVINFQILLLAVPTFFLMSMFLFIQRLEVDGKQYFLHRLKHVMLLYFFWAGVWTIFTWSDQEHQFYNLKYVITFIVRGGFSSFWFFFSLIFLTIVAYLVHRLSKGFIWALLIFSILIIVISNFLARSDPKLSWLTAYYNPMNFTPYVFIAALMNRSNLEWTKNKSILALLSVAFVLTSMVELPWLPHENNFFHNAMAIPPYSRVSIIIGSVVLVMLSFFVRQVRSKVIEFFATYSLALYCLHTFIYMKLESIMSALPARHLSDFIVVVALSSFLGVILRKVLNHRLL